MQSNSSLSVRLTSIPVGVGRELVHDIELTSPHQPNGRPLSIRIVLSVEDSERLAQILQAAVQAKRTCRLVSAPGKEITVQELDLT